MKLADETLGITQTTMHLPTLTTKQQAFLDFIKRHVNEYGTWPKYRHYAEEFGFRSSNSVFQNLKALEQKRYIVRDGGRYRFCQESEPGIPVVGEIKAGCLHEAVEAELGSITLEMLVPNLDRVYALRVNGHSMRGTGISSGDYVLLMDDDIPNGGIGAVLYNGETSLKRIFWTLKGCAWSRLIRSTTQSLSSRKFLRRCACWVATSGILTGAASSRHHLRCLR